MSKTVTAALASSIANTTTTLSTCFKLTLRSGVVNSAGASVLTFTDHDEDVVFSAVTYRTIGGYTRSAVETTGEMKTDQLELAGLILSSTITEKDLRDGVYDYARVEMFMLDWTRPDQGRLWLRAGWLGEVTADDNQYNAELRGMAYLLQQVQGEKYSQTCRYIVGDSKCTASVAIATCVVASVINNGVFVATGAVTQAHTNLVLWSEQFNDATWTKDDTTIATNNLSSPTSTVTAERATEGSTNNAATYQGVAVTPSTDYTISFFLKRGNTDILRVTGFSSAFDLFRLWVNVSTGAILSSDSAGAATTSGTSIQTYTNGWYHVSITGQVPASPLYLAICTATANGSTNRVSGGTYNVWGAQLEQSSSLTSYIQTTSVAVTQAAASTELSTTATRYAGNVVTWYGGNNVGRSMEVQTYDGAGQFKLYLKMPSTIQVGDVFTAKAGCDKTLSNTLGCASFDSTVSGITNNVINFGAEPHIRGDASYMYAKPGPTDSMGQSTSSATTPAPTGNTSGGTTDSGTTGSGTTGSSTVDQPIGTSTTMDQPGVPIITGTAQRWWGNPFAGPFTSLGDTKVKGSRLVAHPFRALHSGPITSFRWYNIFVPSGGYAAGNGGNIRLRLVRSRISDGRPDVTQVLGTAPDLGLAQGIGVFPLQTLTAPASVTEGIRYAVVYDNVNGSPDSNWTGVDDQNTNWHTTADPYAPTPITPAINDYDWRTIYSDNGGSTWIIRPRTPILQINYQSGDAQGSGYENAGGAHGDDYRVGGVDGPIDGTYWVREVFTPNRSFTATHFGICAGISPSAGSAGLTVRIKQGNTIIGTLSFTATEFKNASFPFGNGGSNKDRRWHQKQLASQITFNSGTQYTWEASGTNGTQFYTCASHRGSSFTSGGDVTVGGTAQYSSNSGASWNNWIHQGTVTTKCDLQFYFLTT